MKEIKAKDTAKVMKIETKNVEIVESYYTEEEIINLPEGSKYKVYNPLTGSLKEEISGKNDIAHNKYAYDKLEYYVEREVN